MQSFTAAAAVVLSLTVPCLASTGGRFRGASGSPPTGTGALWVERREVEFSLQSSYEALLRGGDGAVQQRLTSIEASVWQSFQALPKNNGGRLAPRAVRYLVHGYFAKEHGWLIKGLEHHGMQADVNEVHELTLLQDRAPALVEKLLEARQSGRGLSLEDVVVMIAALERLIFDESLQLLETAYSLNFLSATSPVDDDELHEVLTSYLLIFQLGQRRNASDARKHQALKRKMERLGASWRTLVEFEQDAVGNFDYARRFQTNPFVAPRHTFQTASAIVEDLAGDYGKWQNAECREMKEELVKLDINGDGRVPLSSFYAQPETAEYQFSESLDYLRTIGALDESVSDNPGVRIANYMLGPSNCIASSAYYSVCCLSDCEALMNELEGHIKAPAAPAERLLGIVANLTQSSYAPEAPRQLSEDLRQKMTAIGERHGGEVPLHGRLFAQWMHSAFPQECPYPHVHQSTEVLSPSHWSDGATPATASKEEKQRHVELAANQTWEVQGMMDSQPQALEWSDEEVLPLQEPSNNRSFSLRSWARPTAQLAVLLAAVRAVYSGLRGAFRASGKGVDKEDAMLPF